MGLSNDEKWKCSIMTGVLFFIIAHPRTYNLVQGLFNNVELNVELVNDDRVTNTGVLVHTVVFTLLLRLVMNYK